MASPRDRMVEMVSSANPPRVSATTGMKSTRAERQAERWHASLRWMPTRRAWPGVEAASCKVCCWRGEIMWTSSAAGRPRLQVGSTSTGLEWESGTTLGASLVGAKALDWAARNRTSRMALWRMILPPLPPQPTWWSPKGSAVLRHSGQE